MVVGAAAISLPLSPLPLFLLLLLLDVGLEILAHPGEEARLGDVVALAEFEVAPEEDVERRDVVVVATGIPA